MARDLDIKSNIVDSDQYVYRQERDMEKTQVDWSQIAKDVTGTVEKIRDDRQAEKDALAQVQRDTMNTLADYDQYDAEALNKTIIGGAHNASNYLVMLNDQMRSGQISPTDYMMGAQGITDNFAQLKTATKNWDSHYKAAALRVQEGTSNIAEQAWNQTLSSFGNLAAMDLYINPLTGNMSFVKKGADVNDPANHQSISSINARMNQKSDFNDPNALQDQQVAGLAKIISVDTNFNNDASMSLEDFRELTYTGTDGVEKKYEDLIDTYISQSLATEQDKVSVLQALGGYTSDNFVYTEEEFNKDKTKILITSNKDSSGSRVLVFHPEQEEEMRRLLSQNLDTKLDQIYKFDKGFDEKPASNFVIDRGDKQKELLAVGKNLMMVVSGDEKESAAGLRYIVDQSNGAISEIQKTPTGFNIIYPGRDPLPLDTKGMNPEESMRNLWKASGLEEEFDAWLDAGGRELLKNRTTTRGEKIVTGPRKSIEYNRNDAMETPDGGTITAVEYVNNSDLGPTLNRAVDNNKQVQRVYTDFLSKPKFFPPELSGSVRVDGTDMYFTINGIEYQIKDADGNTDIYGMRTGDVTNIMQDLIEDVVKNKKGGGNSSKYNKPKDTGDSEE